MRGRGQLVFFAPSTSPWETFFIFSQNIVLLRPNRGGRGGSKFWIFGIFSRFYLVVSFLFPIFVPVPIGIKVLWNTWVRDKLTYFLNSLKIKTLWLLLKIETRANGSPLFPKVSCFETRFVPMLDSKFMFPSHYNEDIRLFPTVGSLARLGFLMLLTPIFWRLKGLANLICITLTITGNLSTKTQWMWRFTNKN